MSEEQATPIVVSGSFSVGSALIASDLLVKAWAEVYARVQEIQAKARPEPKPETWRDRPSQL
jgi:cytochrome c-type biogenesis protein CcmE